MGWKSTARRIPAAHMRAKHKESAKSFFTENIVIRNGKPWVVKDHIMDFIGEDDDGNKYIEASTRFRRGEYIFPSAYLHTDKRFVGETKDVRLHQNGEWQILLDAVLRDSSGNPILVEGQEIDLSGWFAESSLQDAGLGKLPIRPGATNPTEKDILQAREDRIRRKNAA